MKRLRAARTAILELDVVDLVLVLSVAQYAYDVRELVRDRIRNRRRLVEQNAGAAALVDELAVPGPFAGDELAPDYRGESDSLPANLVSDGVTGRRYDGST